MLSKTSVIKNGSSEEVWVIKQTVGGDGGDMLGGGIRVCLFYSQHYLDFLAVLFIRQEPVKNTGQRRIWRLNYFRDNLYDFLWERRRKSWAVKASLQPWLGHTDIDLTVKTGAGELWCHDSMLSLPLSLKEDGEQRRRRRRRSVEVSGWEAEKDRLG